MAARGFEPQFSRQRYAQITFVHNNKTVQRSSQIPVIDELCDTVCHGGLMYLDSSCLHRTVAAIIGWIKYTLTTEQKKIDFKPDSEEGPIHMYSQVCHHVYTVFVVQTYLLVCILP